MLSYLRRMQQFPFLLSPRRTSPHRPLEKRARKQKLRRRKPSGKSLKRKKTRSHPVRIPFATHTYIHTLRSILHLFNAIEVVPKLLYIYPEYICNLKVMYKFISRPFPPHIYIHTYIHIFEVPALKSRVITSPWQRRPPG